MNVVFSFDMPHGTSVLIPSGHGLPPVLRDARSELAFLATCIPVKDMGARGGRYVAIVDATDAAIFEMAAGFLMAQCGGFRVP